MNYIENKIIFGLTKSNLLAHTSHSKFYKISWSDINLFLQCPHCFYNQKKLGIRLPALDPDSFKLPKAVDECLKKDFDSYRQRREPHPIMVKYGIEAVPFHDANKSIEKWRDPLRADGFGGIQFYDKDFNFLLFGGVDDVWVTKGNELIVVEYKTTSTLPGHTIEQNSWYGTYKQQLSFYAWLLQKISGRNVHEVGYFVYCNGLITDFSDKTFDCSLKFEMTLTASEINDSWLKRVLENMRKYLDNSQAPSSASNCKYCKFGFSFKEIN